MRNEIDGDLKIGTFYSIGRWCMLSNFIETNNIFQFTVYHKCANNFVFI